jgi:hypothetical protein
VERGGGHGLATMPQFVIMFDTVHTVDDLRGLALLPNSPRMGLPGVGDVRMPVPISLDTLNAATAHKCGKIAPGILALMGRS